MTKFSKLALAAMLALTTATAVGCSDAEKPASTTAATDTKEDVVKVQKSIFAAVLIGDSLVTDSFEAKKGLGPDDAEVEYMVPKRQAKETLDILAKTYWDKEVAKKEYEAVLGDQALLDKANAAFEAKVNADNEKAKSEEEKIKFTPRTEVGDADKIGANVLTGAKFEDIKVEGKDGQYTLEYKGLKYTVKKDGNQYRIIAKEGTLQK
ncbi:hypothetical protein OS242_08050 [Tumebacillus sp. DT12]|uniref:Lipoprotein n=1 Tax=Tumebacillus lacus TaxID=2995335 RepID=A0ABT3WZ19_9BACL|nr:hypothetical protein [Tumebacillus lacus]MCX7569915.1 hypothetical protein [Tumebacillus lacus]